MLPGITDVQTSLEAGIPQQEIYVSTVTRSPIWVLSVRDVTELLQTAVAGSKAGEYRTEGNAYRILVQLKDAEKRSLNEILNLTLTTASGEKVAPAKCGHCPNRAAARSSLTAKNQQRTGNRSAPMSPDATWGRWPKTSRPCWTGFPARLVMI